MNPGNCPMNAPTMLSLARQHLSEWGADIGLTTMLISFAEKLAALSQEVPARTCATCHAILADGPQPAATYNAVPQRDRDGIARIIDHYAFATANWERPDIQFKQTQAFAKADAIIALSRHQPQCAPDPSEEIAIRAAQIDERWRQAMRDLRELAIDEGNKKIERRCFDLIMGGPAHTRPDGKTP